MVNHRLPSTPVVIPYGEPSVIPVQVPQLSANSVITPAGVMRPISLLPYSVNQRFPSGPAVMIRGFSPGVGSWNSVTVPEGVMRPMALPPGPVSVNHMFPSGPAVMEYGIDPAVTPVRNSVIAPSMVTRAIPALDGALSAFSATHMLPSGPAAIPSGVEPADRPVENSVTSPAVVMRAMAPDGWVNHMLPSGPAAIPIGAGSAADPGE